MGLRARARRTATVVALALALAVAVPAATGVAASAAAVPVELDALTDRRAAAEAELDAVLAEVEAVGARRSAAEDERRRLRADLDTLRRAAEAAEELRATRALDAYRSLGAATLELLLGASGSGDALDRARLLDGLGQRERRAVERADRALAAYAQRRARLAAVEAALAADAERLADLRATLDATFAAARAAELELVSRRDRQRTVSRDGQRGTYACPLAQPLWFRDTWGAPRSGGRSHKGVDLFAPMGADVYAITAGEVVRHSTGGLGGVGLYLAGDDGNQYYYAHLREIAAGYVPGRRVEAGERIASNGDSGNARGGPPHVHFEVRPGGGAPVNPYPFAAASCD